MISMKKKENLMNQLLSQDNQQRSIVNKNQINIPKVNQQKQMLRKQLELVKNKQVRAVPDGYYTGLINDIHKDYKNFHEKTTLLQMDYFKPLIQQISISINQLNHERKLDKSHAPITLNSLSIQCTLPSDYRQLENLSPFMFLKIYSKPSILREQIIRKIQRDSIFDFHEAKEIVFEYFNHYQTHEIIDEFFRFLEFQSNEIFQLKDIIVICCYAERYFLHRLAEKEEIFFPRPLQEIIDFEFLKRKFSGLNLTEKFRDFLKTLEAPKMNN